MKNIIKFNTCKDFTNFLKDKVHCKPIGEGVEGVCFVSRNGEEVYKIITKPAEKYDVNKIITVNDIDINLSHYLLPQELYVLNDNTLIGYKTKYIREKNLFEFNNLIKSNYTLNQINFDSLITAYYEILKETDLLSDKNILIYDLAWNLYFTGKNFYGIDTCGYKNVKKDVHKINKDIVEETLKDIFATYLMFHEENYDNLLSDIHKEQNMKKYLKKLTPIIKK